MKSGEDMGFLMTWANWMCLWPKREKGVFTATPRRCYLRLILVLSAYAYTLYGRLMEDYYYTRKMFIIIGMICTSLVTVCDVDTVFGSFTWKVQRVQKFFDGFEELDALLASQGFVFVNKTLRLKITFVLVHVFYVCLIVLEVFWWLEEIYYFQFVLLDRYLVYNLFVMIALEANVLRHLRSRLASINKMIEKAVDETDVDCIAKLHGLCLELIESFNSIQGRHLFYTMINYIVNTLIIVQNMLEPDFVWETQAILHISCWFCFILN